MPAFTATLHTSAVSRAMRKSGENVLDVKVNFPSVLEKQLRSRRTPPKGRILLGTVTDAYQVDCLNPYATVVHSLRNSYRSHFPRALAALEEFLLHPASYRREAAGRIHKLISREGNGDEVRAV